MVATLELLPTAPGRLPGVGHLVPLLTGPLRFVRSLHRHGEIVRIFFGGLPVYVVTHPEPLRDVLVTSGRDFDKGRIFDKGKAFLGEGLITSAGELHHRHRRMVQPAFHHEKIGLYAERMRELAAELAGSWRAGEPIELNTVMNRLAFDIVTRSMFDVDIPAQVAQRLHDGLPLLLRASMMRAFAPSAWERLPLPAHRRYTTAVAGVRSVVDDLLEQHPAGGQAEANLVSMLRSARDGEFGEAMSPVQLRDELLNILIAGTETTGGTMAWFFYELARHGDVQDRFHEEIDTVLGRAPVREENLADLEYTRCVLKETLRLHSLWLSTRRALRAVRVGGVDIPAGTELAFSLDAIHRHPRIYGDPDEFRPQRWSPAAEGTVPRNAFIPFLTGSRQCVGDAFAWTEMLTVIATIAATWRLQLLPGQRIREAVTATVRPSRLTMVPMARTR